MLELAVTLLAALGFMTLVMLLGWFVQRRLDEPAWSDVFWTFGVGVSGLVAGLVPLTGMPASPFRRVLIAGLCGAWSLRLGGHIARRVAGGGKDARYTQMRQQSGDGFQRQMLGFMLVQAPIGAALAGCVMLASHAPGPFSWRDLAAVTILILATAGEAAADSQLAAFKADPANHGRVCDTGLWSLSRHPNYVCEWLVWTAYPVAALGFGLARPWFWATLVAPLLMYLLLRRVSGVPPLERSMLASRGETYRAYQARTPVFFPFLKAGA